MHLDTMDEQQHKQQHKQVIPLQQQEQQQFLVLVKPHPSGLEQVHQAQLVGGVQCQFFPYQLVQGLQGPQEDTPAQPIRLWLQQGRQDPTNQAQLQE